MPKKSHLRAPRLQADGQAIRSTSAPPTGARTRAASQAGCGGRGRARRPRQLGPASPMTYAFVGRQRGRPLHADLQPASGERAVGRMAQGQRGPRRYSAAALDSVDAVRPSASAVGQFYPGRQTRWASCPQAQLRHRARQRTRRFNYDGRFPLFGDDSIWSVENNTTVPERAATRSRRGLYFEHSHNVEGLTAETSAAASSSHRDAQQPARHRPRLRQRAARRLPASTASRARGRRRTGSATSPRATCRTPGRSTAS